MSATRKNNLLLGIVLLVTIGIVKTLWGMMENTLLVWRPLIDMLPFLPEHRELSLFAAACFWLVVITIMVRSLRRFGLFIARDVSRARRMAVITKRFRIDWTWRLIMGFLILADALAELEPVRVSSYDGKRDLGFITKVQRTRDARAKKSNIEFIVYSGDFPSFFLGRWSWYETKNCQKIIGPVSDIFKTFGSVGLAAPSKFVFVHFSPEDIVRIEENLKTKEAFLLAAGLLKPEDVAPDEEKP